MDITPLLILVVLCSGDGNVISPTVRITSMNIESKIVARLARVQVTTQMKNYENGGLETHFSFQLPETAFISNFTMVIGGKTINGIVKEKAHANQIYEESKNKGLTTARIKLDNKPDRFMKYFTTSANLAAKSKVLFILEYHEVLERRLGLYTQKISFNPKQIVPELTFKAKIYDQEGIDRFEFMLPGLNQMESSSTNMAIVKASDNTRELYFKPLVLYQQELDPEEGMSGEIVMSYDVEHSNDAGVILLQNDYFVHYIAPSGLNVLDKNIIFIIDISGSMQGLKMEQTRIAMFAILHQLHRGDYFNILLFDNQISVWKTEPMVATMNNVIEAEDFVREGLYPQRSTNINSALLNGIDMLGRSQSLGGTRGNIMVFLTDGRPTAGERNTKVIRRLVKNANRHRFSLFSLGFGYDVDMPFLKALSWENGGFARRIYAENDASHQLERFYQELQNPTLVDVEVVYEENAVETESLTQSIFPQYFRGSEIVIAGRRSIHAPSGWTARVQAKGSGQSLNAITKPLLFRSTNVDEPSVIEKIWAYMKINDLFKEIAKTDDMLSKMALKNLTLSLCLKYNFVTSLTSMVVSESFVSGETLMARDADRSYRTRAKGQHPTLNFGIVDLMPKRKRFKKGYSRNNILKRGDSSMEKRGSNGNQRIINNDVAIITIVFMVFSFMC